MYKGLLILMALAMGNVSANAQWINQQQGGAFDDDPLHLSLTAKGNYALGLRCKSDRSEIVLITQDESFDRATLKMANIVGATLLVRVDRGEILRLDAQIELIDGKAVFIANAEVDLFRAIASGRNSVATAVELLGKKYHENSFGVSGSRAAMNSIIAKCKLDKAS